MSDAFGISTGCAPSTFTVVLAVIAQPRWRSAFNRLFEVASLVLTSLMAPFTHAARCLIRCSAFVRHASGGILFAINRAVDSRSGQVRLAASFLLLIAVAMAAVAADPPAAVKVGVQGEVGCDNNPKRVNRLLIDKPGVYENYLVDGEWGESTLVKITADNVTLRRCEIRNARSNAIVIDAKNTVIDSCRIHHLLSGTFEKPDDAHGITGRPRGLVVHNCDIGLVSGDAIQFDPGRGEWDQVTIEQCTLWTGPLPADAAGFKAGQRPGENAVDTKQRAKNPRSRLTIRNCLMYGWNQPAQISNVAALNLKNHVQAEVRDCVFRDVEIAFRLRGGTGDYGGAHVSIDHCAIYDARIAVRAEDKIENLRITRLGLGEGVREKLHQASGGPGKGYTNTGEYTPPGYETVIKEGLEQDARPAGAKE